MQANCNEFEKAVKLLGLLHTGGDVILAVIMPIHVLIVLL